MGKRLFVLISVLVLTACTQTTSGVQAAPEEMASTETSNRSSTSLRMVLKVTPTKLFGDNIPAYVSDILQPDSPVTYDVRLPAGFDPARPAPLLVYIPPTPRLFMPQSWEAMLDKHNVIFVAARRSGNTVTNGRRISLALMARVAAAGNWTLDEEHIFVSGFSGGGRVASLLMIQFPKAFEGAIYFSGVNFVPGEETLYEQIRHKRFVFIAGEFDFNLEGTKEVRKNYEDIGVTYTKLIVVPKMEHELPPGNVLDDALTYLLLR